jgi:hypothetical protein
VVIIEDYSPDASLAPLDEKVSQKSSEELPPPQPLVLLPSSAVTEIPGLGEATAQVLWANAYVGTVRDLAQLPRLYPGILTAITERGDLPMLDQLIEAARKV